MSRNRLYESSQVGPSHAKDESPAILRVQVAISQDEEALITLGLQLVPNDHIEEVLSVKLLPLSIGPHTRLDQLVCLKILEV